MRDNIGLSWARMVRVENVRCPIKNSCAQTQAHTDRQTHTHTHSVHPVHLADIMSFTSAVSHHIKLHPLLYSQQRCPSVRPSGHSLVLYEHKQSSCCCCSFWCPVHHPPVTFMQGPLGLVVQLSSRPDACLHEIHLLLFEAAIYTLHTRT